MSDLKKAYHTIQDDHFPAEMTISFGPHRLVYRKRVWRLRDEDTGEVAEKGLRYGENPGQEAALYELVNGNLVLGDCRFIEPGRGLVSSLSEDQLHQFGKHPSKINLTDIDSGLNILKYLADRPAAVVMKHNNPSGAACGQTIGEAFEKAYGADRLAAMGGCVVLNGTVDRDMAGRISERYFEVIAAPGYEPGAVDVLKSRKNLRIVEIRALAELQAYAAERFVDFKSLQDGGMIVQQSPLNRIRSVSDFLPATVRKKGVDYRIRRPPTEEELRDLLFGWQVEQGVTSNSVIYVKGLATVGVGTGEQDRVGVAKIARDKAYEKYADGLCYRRFGLPLYQLELAVSRGERHAEEVDSIRTEARAARGDLIGSAMISDGFFPFRDGVDVGIREGVTSVCQPGGSINDHEVIEACNEASPPVAMVFTGQRAFRH
ncbi:MAG: IMP cyclohydrolase [Planctomycetes bacterium]|nr:IMP cyclohydrolase [Planctomycetota bacterium]